MAEFISIKADLDEVYKFLSELDIKQDKMRKRILSGIGTGTKNAVKKAYKSFLNKQSGTLYKSFTSKVVRSGEAVIVSPQAEKNKVRYGYVLAAGTVIRPIKERFLTFKIGDKWIRKHEVTITSHDFVEGPVKQYLSSQSYRDRLDTLVKKEVLRAEKAAQKKAK